MANGTKISISPNDVQNIAFVDGQPIVSGESIDAIKQEIAALKEQQGQESSCNCSSEIDALESEILTLNHYNRELIAMINTMQMQIVALENQLGKMQDNSESQNSQGGDNNQSGNNDDTIDNNSLEGVWYLKSEKWYDWANGEADMSKAPYEKNYEDFSAQNVWEIVKNGEKYYINESRYGEVRDTWNQVDTYTFRNHSGEGRDRLRIKSVSDKTMVIELFDGYYGEGYETEKTSEYGILSFMR